MGVIHTTRKNVIVTPAIPVECVSLSEIQLHYGLHFHFLLYLTFSLSEKPEMSLMPWVRKYMELGHVNKDHWRIQDLPDLGIANLLFWSFCPKIA